MRTELETRVLHIQPCEMLLPEQLSKSTEKLVSHLALHRWVEWSVWDGNRGMVEEEYEGGFRLCHVMSGRIHTKEPGAPIFYEIRCVIYSVSQHNVSFTLITYCALVTYYQL